MTGLSETLYRFRGGRAALPPFLADATDGPLTVARDLFEHPETTTLPDGRRLGYAETGDPDGEPLLVLHGWPNCRLFAAAFDRVAREHGARVVAPERPGFGVSDPDSDRDLTDWPADVTALLDALGIGSAPVLGVSGGGPYALACAALAPERVPRAAVACGVGPMTAVGIEGRLPFLAGRYTPRAVRAYLRAEELAARYVPERTLARRAEAAAPHDRDLWLGDVGKLLLATGLATRQRHGNAHLGRDLQLYASDWGFDLGDVDVPVGLWYGRADRIVPVEMGRYLAEAVPTAESHFYPDLGHVGIVQEHEPAILDWLAR
jgi:pimeloyl-ACP methyl ester carboxylesterase